MSLAAASKVGPYEIVAPLGAGGMGEVYRAKDTRLGRDVALKVIPEAFASDAQRMARFEREAKVLASLNHPNIAVLYGFEESNATRALVMELVDGPMLGERIKQGALALADPLAIHQHESSLGRVRTAWDVDEPSWLACRSRGAAKLAWAPRVWKGQRSLLWSLRARPFLPSSTEMYLPPGARACLTRAASGDAGIVASAASWKFDANYVALGAGTLRKQTA